MVLQDDRTKEKFEWKTSRVWSWLETMPHHPDYHHHQRLASTKTDGTKMIVYEWRHKHFDRSIICLKRQQKVQDKSYNCKPTETSLLVQLKTVLRLFVLRYTHIGVIELNVSLWPFSLSLSICCWVFLTSDSIKK